MNNQPRSIKLFCWILDVSTCSFSISIDDSQTVDDLKKVIVKEKSTTFANIEADLLELRKVSVPTTPALRNKVVKEEFHRADPLDETEPLSDAFSLHKQEPAKRTLHIVVRVPPIDSSANDLSQGLSNLSIDDPDVSASIRNLPRVSSECDKITDDDHKALDATILTTFSANRQFKQEPDLSSLLGNITHDDTRLKPLSSDEAKKLLQNQPLINTMLKNAWLKGVFKEVRQLAVLWPERTGKILADTYELVNETVKSSVKQAFESKFLGDTNFLCDAIRDVFSSNNEERYSNSFSIIQSSGTGKSRLVDEMAKTLFTFPICVRADDPQRRLSYPPPDRSIRNFLKNFANGDKDERKIGALCLLFGLFTNGFAELDTLKSRLRNKSVAASWRDHLRGGNRTNFYQNAVAIAKEKSNERLSVDELQVLVMDAHRQLWSKAFQLDHGYNDDPSSEERSAGDNPIVVYIDEAHEIGSLDGITSVFGDLKQSSVVGIYLSTASRISHLAPSPQTIDSDRNAEDTTHLLPFTEVSLDPFSHQYFKGPSGDLSLKKVRSIIFSASLGRPLWSAHLQTKIPYPISSLLSLAEAKLTGSVKESQTSKLGQRALISCRLLIHHTENQAGRQLAKELVASHMSFAYMPTNDRSILRAGYPPEPFLSAAAVRRMPSNYRTWVSWLKEMIVSDYVRKGDRGELICRVLLTIAHDLARKAEMDRMNAIERGPKPPLGLNSSLPGHEPARVCDFLKYFVGENEWDRVANAKPTNIASENGETLGDFLGERAVVDFTCFGVAKDDSAFTYQGMVQALCQGASLVCATNQRSYDHVVVFLRDRDRGFTLDNMGLLLVQDKNTLARQNPVLDPSKLPCGNKVPIISILHQPSQPRLVTIKSAPEVMHRSAVNPLYEIQVDGSELLDSSDLHELLMADDPLESHRKGSVLAHRSQGIVKHNRYYAVSSQQPPDSFDINVNYV